MIDMVAYIGQSFPNEAARRQRRVWVFCGIQNVESCQGVICGKSSAERSTNCPWLHSTAENPHFHGSQNNRSLTLYNRCVTDALQHPVSCGLFLPYSLWSVCQRTGYFFLQFWLTSKSLPHSRCLIISLVDMIGFSLYNQCDSRTDDRTN